MTESSPVSRKVVLTLFVSLDGVVENPAWTAPYRADDSTAFKHAELFESDVLLLGRVTYQGFAAYWPSAQGTGDFGERMNSLPKLVVATTLRQPAWNAEFIGGDVVEAVQQLKAQPGQNILIYGSRTLAQTLMAHGLIDEYRFLVYPLVLGKGQKLFPDGAAPLTLKLTSAQTFSSGVVALIYSSQPSALLLISANSSPNM
ncbi:dihydrofolate reductase family protein [Deinococcus sp.]|uniref:dihydrofolate reductase family protein n=1 Tax=Deinococcus sp. TaxID=47478 RepID=UPI003CC55669